MTDRRTYKDRRDVFAIEKKAAEFVAERPKAKIKQVAAAAEEAGPRKTKREPATRQKTQETKEEEDLVSC